MDDICRDCSDVNCVVTQLPILGNYFTAREQYIREVHRGRRGAVRLIRNSRAGGLF
jgi:hypothetical protein